MCRRKRLFVGSTPGGSAAADPGSSTPDLSGITLGVSTAPMTGGIRHLVTGADGIDVGATLLVGGVAHGLEYIDATSFAFVSATVAFGSQGAKSIQVTNPNAQTDTKTNALTYALSGETTVTTWADFVDALSTGLEGLVVRLTSTNGAVCRARVASSNVFNFVGWIDLRNASTTLINEMFTTVFGTAFTSLDPGSTGGIRINCGTDAQASVVLDDVQCDGAYRGILAEFVWDTIDDASIGYNKGFCAGFRARGIADTSASLRGGGPCKTSSNTYRWSYCYNSLQGFTVTNSSAAISAGAINSAGVVCTCYYFAKSNGNVASGHGTDIAGGSVPTQTAGPAVATGVVTAAHCERTDLQPCFCNNAVDGSNVIRLIRFKLTGDFSKF